MLKTVKGIVLNRYNCGVLICREEGRKSKLLMSEMHPPPPPPRRGPPTEGLLQLLEKPLHALPGEQHLLPITLLYGGHVDHYRLELRLVLLIHNGVENVLPEDVHRRGQGGGDGRPGAGRGDGGGLQKYKNNPILSVRSDVLLQQVPADGRARCAGSGAGRARGSAPCGQIAGRFWRRRGGRPSCTSATLPCRRPSPAV